MTGTIILLVVLAAIPELRIAIVPLALFGILAYALGTGPGRNSLSTNRRDDRPLVAATAGSYRGVTAAVIAATGIASLVELREPEGQSVLLMVYLLGVSAALGGFANSIRHVLTIGIGIAATIATVVKLFGPVCGSELPSSSTAVFVVVPLLGLLCGAFAARILWAGTVRLLEELGSLAVASFALLQMGAIAVAPAGVALWSHSDLSAWPLASALALLAIIAVAVGLQPRAGADLVALGLLAVSAFFLGFDTPCGLTFTALMVTAVVFIAGVVSVAVVRRLTRY